MSNVKNLTINAMAPLAVGEPGEQTWDQFTHDWNQGRDRGLHGVAFDMWWRDFQPERKRFDWSRAEKTISIVRPRQGKAAPVLSFHKCGGNVGDTVTKNLPDWAWVEALRRLEEQYGVGKYTMDALKFMGSNGHLSDHYFSHWVTDLVIDVYGEAMEGFLKHFGSSAADISEINISGGPAGEFRMPSYFGKEFDYPNAGSMQCNGDIARLDLELSTIVKYGSREAAETAWGKKIDRSTIMPVDWARFFRRQEHIHTQYGRDLMGWYAGVPVKHFKTLMGKALNVFAADGSALKGIDLGCKFPGIHWRVGHTEDGQVVFADRLAEIAAGLIRPGVDWYEDADGRGYAPIIDAVKSLQGKGSRVVMHYTCLEMPDGDGGAKVGSMANSLVRWVGKYARAAGVPLKGENALGWNLPNKRAWELMRQALTIGGGDYFGLTLLRLSDCLGSDVAREEFTRTLKWVNENQPA